MERIIDKSELGNIPNYNGIIPLTQPSLDDTSINPELLALQEDMRNRSIKNNKYS